jgi:hypothetical protein
VEDIFIVAFAAGAMVGYTWLPFGQESVNPTATRDMLG